MSLDPSLPVDERIKVLRERRGLSRAVVAGLCGRSESWLKKIEQGTRQAVRLPTLLRLAEILRLDDLAELTGQRLPLAVYGKSAHPARSRSGVPRVIPARRSAPCFRLCSPRRSRPCGYWPGLSDAPLRLCLPKSTT
jgi:transcriptional regulator with XRE-family HTH domain